MQAQVVFIHLYRPLFINLGLFGEVGKDHSRILVELGLGILVKLGPFTRIHAPFT
jgi:hypothetical protein